MSPYLVAQQPSFAFLLHPRGIEDVYEWSGGSLLRQYCDSHEQFLERACSQPPLKVGEVRFGFAPTYGELVAAARLPHQIVSRKGQAFVREALEVALARGAPVIGLGALTSPVTRGGERLIGDLPAGATITNGNGYTAFVVAENVSEVASELGLGTAAKVAIVGCTGSVGGPASRLLHEKGFGLALIGRSEAAVVRCLGSIADCAQVSNQLESVLNTDIVVLLSGDRSARLSPSHTRSGAVVIDCCQPVNIPVSSYSRFAAKGVSVVAGGLVRIPQYSCSFDFHLPSSADAFACLAETYLVAREGIHEHSVGTPSVSWAKYMGRVARRHRVVPRPLGPYLGSPKSIAATAG